MFVFFLKFLLIDKFVIQKIKKHEKLVILKIFLPFIELQMIKLAKSRSRHSLNDHLQ
jgi:hypothetical protein